ncbi:M56 family metallopeptidase [Spirosoma fluviale]|uniref:Outer membrane transport energization protein TonB n=1 Tax=Spirosoma fluviale TaxID=1597977 RepID=A0A286FZH6_9BACT|nr:M56 family metallopeptidase [Spirosoma fluviale]SOD88655.1 outer membrane transport energization protein TonB [Spirosoma fluviale]
MNTLPYLLTASLYLLLFYGCYALLLRRNTFFGMNRAYLLVSVGLSLLLPLVELPTGTGDSLPVGTIILPTFVIGSPQPQSDSLTASDWLCLIYGLGVFATLVRMGVNLWSVFRLIRRGTAKRTPAYTLVQLPTNEAPSFSFGRYLVLNQTDARTQPEALMRHEEAHIRQRHTADVLLLEVTQAFFWFNPVLWLYKRALQEIHEFLADQAAVRQLSASTIPTHYIAAQPTYAQQLVAYALDVPMTALTTPFVSKSTLKQRIVMLQKPQTHRRALLGYVLALPLAALLTMCTQSEQDQTALTTAETSARKSVKVDGEIFTVVEQQPEFPGGMAQLGAYLEKNMKYPEAALKANVHGRVFVSFIVTKTGEISDVQILKGIGYGADAEAVRVVKNMPNWTPARQNGEVVNVKYNLPINFQLDAEAPSSNESAFKDIAIFLVDGKPVTQKEFTAVSPAKIARMDVDKPNKTVSIITK